jgi:uncharacterized protein (DUF697 family)
MGGAGLLTKADGRAVVLGMAPTVGVGVDASGVGRELVMCWPTSDGAVVTTRGVSACCAISLLGRFVETVFSKNTNSPSATIPKRVTMI